MKFVAALLLIVLCNTGCSLLPRPVLLEAGRNYASLTFRDTSPPPVDHWDLVGMWAVDESRFKTPQMHIYVRPGKRSIRWLCSGWISMDDFPAFDFTFEAGTNYEMVCEEKGPQIIKVQ